VAPILFPYKAVSGRFEPMIPVGIQIHANWQPLRMYVDSGAMYSVLKSSLADDLGFDYRQGDRMYLQVGSGGLMAIYIHQLEMQIGGERFPCRVGFSSQLNIPFHVLGRVDVFERFKVCFQEHLRLLTFDPVQP
jgi:predicted aspartyl protease